MVSGRHSTRDRDDKAVQSPPVLIRVQRGQQDGGTKRTCGQEARGVAANIAHLAPPKHTQVFALGSRHFGFLPGDEGEVAAEDAGKVSPLQPPRLRCILQRGGGFFLAATQAGPRLRGLDNDTFGESTPVGPSGGLVSGLQAQRPPRALLEERERVKLEVVP